MRVALHRVLTLTLSALMLALACCRAEDAVSRQEFERLMQAVQQFKDVNEKLRTDNDSLKHDNAQIKAENQQLRQDVESLKAPNRPVASGVGRLLTAKDEDRYFDKLEALKSGSTKFLLSGYFYSGYDDRVHSNSTCTSAFSPAFLWQISDKLSFETRLVFTLDIWHYVYADANYIVNDNLTLSAGRILPPVGYFVRNLREQWANKFPDFPIHTRLIPPAATGVMASGGVNAGPVDVNYALAVTNGPALITGGFNSGLLRFGDQVDTNNSKNVSGRVGVLPMKELELGVSFDVGRVGPDRTPQEDVDARILLADLSFTRTFTALKGTIDLRAEWAWSHVDPALYNGVPIEHNSRNGGYEQLAFRPTLVDSKWLKNFEAVARVEHLNEPRQPGELGGGVSNHFVGARTRTRYGAGLNYWLNSSTVLKFTYENDTVDGRSILMQWVMGF